MEWLVSILSSSGLGSIIGLAGGLITKRLEIKSNAQKLAHQLHMRKLDLQELQAEQGHELAIADKQMQRAKVEGDIEVEKADIAAFTKSQDWGNTEGVLRFVRPMITAYLLIASTFLFHRVWAAVGGIEGLSEADLMEMLMLMVNAALFLTVTCVSWWFGSRGGNMFRK